MVQNALFKNAGSGNTENVTSGVQVFPSPWRWRRWSHIVFRKSSSFAKTNIPRRLGVPVQAVRNSPAARELSLSGHNRESAMRVYRRETGLF